jgi:DNA-binding response OmpR family regulator
VRHHAGRIWMMALVFVSSLKRKLGWNSASRFGIQTVRGVGYRMEVEGT